jgi:hypothetical protein
MPNSKFEMAQFLNVAMPWHAMACHGMPWHFQDITHEDSLFGFAAASRQSKSEITRAKDKVRSC